MKRLGPIGKAWEAAKRILKPAFERAGITTCEHCGNDSFLSWAHLKKRRDIPRGSPELFRVVLLCTMHRSGIGEGCHQRFEDQPEILEAIIANRETQPEIKTP